MSTNAIRSALRRVTRIVPLRWLPLDGMLRGAQRLASMLAAALFVKDWQLEARGRPQFFKHQINLSRWSFEPARWSFVARGVYARELMFRGCKVLDLCCGDGSYSHLFFSDIAGKVDAVDNDLYAIDYARRYHASAVVNFHRTDIIADPLPDSGYDVVVWNAAICYFSQSDLHDILRKIIAAGAPGMQLCGMLPKANGWIDHKTEFSDLAAVERFLKQFFSQVALREIDEGSAITFYFQASVPVSLRE